MEKGCIHIYSGDGKGKTTAAIGLSVRFAGSGGKVLFVQFLKGRETGELKPLGSLGITVLRSSNSGKFIFDMNDEEKRICRKESETCFYSVVANCTEYGLIVFDEILDAVFTGMISEQSVADFLVNKPGGLEVVLTGHSPSVRLIELADYYSEIVMKKHPYEKGLAARKGIEY
jgi:cob(I)alamin adenosyltransferase